MTQTLDQLIAENARLRGSQPIGSSTTLLVWAIIVLCVLAAGFVAVVTFIKPAADNTQTILLVLGVVVPVITALLAAAVQQVHLAVNSRLTALLALTEKSARAEGKLDGLMLPTPGADTVARAEGTAAGVEQERTRAEHKGE